MVLHTLPPECDAALAAGVKGMHDDHVVLDDVLSDVELKPSRVLLKDRRARDKLTRAVPPTSGTEARTKLEFIKPPRGREADRGRTKCTQSPPLGAIVTFELKQGKYGDWRVRPRRRARARRRRLFC